MCSCLIKGVTWARESHGLFDFESRHPHKTQLRTGVEQKVLRNKRNELLLVDPETDLAETFKKEA